MYNPDLQIHGTRDGFVVMGRGGLTVCLSPPPPHSDSFPPDRVLLRSPILGRARDDRSVFYYNNNNNNNSHNNIGGTTDGTARAAPAYGNILLRRPRPLYGGSGGGGRAKVAQAPEPPPPLTARTR